ncbi:5-formaminoimidazole-4-carboxamide-1-(beta)-D-ribofuranosyl 5'-monophosphate synthetase [archaeon SCG-AAA382B04]|nr:5-formaminoimidazole-4-carboxamide-1-(beta)-D-ribofuranosyl 5'-monophosphate synthetase [archaeon SCG-AAA382B04]
MIEKETIRETLSEYDKENITLGILCSHSALQLIHGAKLEGFNTIGICPEEREKAYKAFPKARADEYMIVDQFDEILEDDRQEELLEKNTIIIPHGSFVEYVGAEKLLEQFRVPIFGNRNSLIWEGKRIKQREWLKKSGVNVPKRYNDPSKIDGKVFVKFSGAKGGRGFFIANSEEDFEEKVKKKIEKGYITEEEAENATIQEFVPGIRYYPHYFHSTFDRRGAETEDGAIEILGMDRRVEPIDESYRGLPNVPEEFFDYTVTGNEPLTIREKLLVNLIDMGINVVETSKNLFSGGINGPFCLETVFHPDEGFTTFEISGRIVAGTNLYPLGSPYSAYLFEEPMSTGRRMAREIKDGAEAGELEKVVY